MKWLLLVLLTGCEAATRIGFQVNSTEVKPKPLEDVVCHWQQCAQVDPGEDLFACGPPSFGSFEELERAKVEASSNKRFIVDECIRKGEKTPAWIKPSGLYLLKGKALK